MRGIGSLNLPHGLKRGIKRAYKRLRRRLPSHDTTALLLLGLEMSRRVAKLPPNMDFRDVGFRVFSQWDEDGIIQYLIHQIPMESRTFIEFGVEDYEESNTRFLLMNNFWRGLVIDGCAADIRYVESDQVFWQHDLQVRHAWITRSNIDSLLVEAGFGSDIGLLSIDIDGNDYWVWEAIRSLRPRIVVIEYNSMFGLEPISIPYSDDFSEVDATFYYGCSLGALCHLAALKGYVLVGSNSWGNNAFFVRADVAGELLPRRAEDIFVACQLKSRDKLEGKPWRNEQRLKLIEHKLAVNVITGELAPFRELYRPVPATDATAVARRFSC